MTKDLCYCRHQSCKVSTNWNAPLVPLKMADIFFSKRLYKGWICSEWMRKADVASHMGWPHQ